MSRHCEVRALLLASLVAAALVTFAGVEVTEASASAVSASRHAALAKRVRLRNPVLPDLFIYEGIENTTLTACRDACANDTQCDIYMFVNECSRCFLHHVV